MGQVLEFRKTERHATGDAFCIACDHEWAAVVPYPVPDHLECPSCHAMRGQFKFDFGPTEGAVFTCNCGNQLFYMTLNGTYCPRCGQEQCHV